MGAHSGQLTEKQKHNLALGGIAARKHGLYGTREYRSWEAMKRRCFVTTDKAFSNYGGRGITVCERWMQFESFYADMGPMPTSHHTIERKNVNGHYEPDNCIWATYTTQARNRRTSWFLTRHGVTKLFIEWCAQLGVPYHVAASRVYRRGWDTERALTTPILSRAEAGRLGGRRKHR